MSPPPESPISIFPGLLVSLLLHAGLAGCLALATGDRETRAEVPRWPGAMVVDLVSLEGAAAVASDTSPVADAIDAVTRQREPSPSMSTAASTAASALASARERKPPIPSKQREPSPQPKSRDEVRVAEHRPAPPPTRAPCQACVGPCGSAAAPAATAPPEARLPGHASGWPGPAQLDSPARPGRAIRPDYPARERRRGHESTVVVEAWVDEWGEVAFSSIVSSGGEAFDHSALAAVSRTPFIPARDEGREVASRVALRLHFSLRR